MSEATTVDHFEDPEGILPTDPTLRAHLRRLRENVVPEGELTPDADQLSLDVSVDPDPHGGRGRDRLRDPERVWLETNLGRKGFWSSGKVGEAAAGASLVSLLDTNDQLGPIRQVEGRRLGTTAMMTMIWVCSRWREQGDPDADTIPWTLSALAQDLRWKHGGRQLRALEDVVRSLQGAVFEARIYDARAREMRIRTFQLLADAEVGERDRRGSPSRPGYLRLSKILVEHLRRNYATFLEGWEPLLDLESPTARRLFVYLEGEHWPTTGALQRGISANLLTTLGITAQRPDNARKTLRRACEEIESAGNRYHRVCVEQDQRGRWHLVAERRRPRLPRPEPV